MSDMRGRTPDGQLHDVAITRDGDVFTTPRRLKALVGENLSVSTTAVGITATVIPSNVVMARVYHKSGGGVHYNAGSTPTGAGVTGDMPFDLDDELEVWGQPDLKSVKWIVRTGQAAAVLAIQPFEEIKP